MRLLEFPGAERAFSQLGAKSNERNQRDVAVFAYIDDRVGHGGRRCGPDSNRDARRHAGVPRDARSGAEVKGSASFQLRGTFSLVLYPCFQKRSSTKGAERVPTEVGGGIAAHGLEREGLFKSGNDSQARRSIALFRVWIISQEHIRITFL